MNKQTVLKEVSFFLQSEDKNGSYLENLEDDMQQINKILPYYKEILQSWVNELQYEGDTKTINLYNKYINLIDSVL